MTNSVINLVADIGGTNIRIGIFKNDEKVHSLKVFQCGNYESLADVLQAYIDDTNLNGALINACLAIACPVENDLVSMTNLPWEFSKKALKERLQLNKLSLIHI